MNSGEISIPIFLDLSKAFDTLNNAILLDKLKHYGIKYCASNLLNSYLSDMQQFSLPNPVFFQLKQGYHKDLFLVHFFLPYIQMILQMQAISLKL